MSVHKFSTNSILCWPSMFSNTPDQHYITWPQSASIIFRLVRFSFLFIHSYLFDGDTYTKYWSYTSSPQFICIVLVMYVPMYVSFRVLGVKGENARISFIAPQKLRNPYINTIILCTYTNTYIIIMIIIV